MKFKTNWTRRFRIYNKINGVEDFVGVDAADLERRALAAVHAYQLAGIEAYYIGEV